jgi:hypothetical protein
MTTCRRYARETQPTELQELQVTQLYRFAAAVMAATVAMPLAAQQSSPAAMPPAAQTPKLIDGVGAADVTTLTAKIEAVDHENRTVTLKGPMGRSETLKVDPKVKNFAQVKAGDDIVVKYSEAISVKLEKDVKGRSASVATTGPITAPAGSKPGMAAERQTVIVAKVVDLDPKRQEVLLQGPNNGYAEVKVKDPAVFNDVKVGDHVQVTYTEAVVVDVVTPAAKK